MDNAIGLVYEAVDCGADLCERVQSGCPVTTFSLSPEDRDSVILLLSWRVVLWRLEGTKAEGKLALNLLWG